MLFNIYLILMGLSLPVLGNRPCSQSGFFRDPENCSQFYRCVNWYGNYFTSFKFSCPLGTAFDDSIDVCNHISQVRGCLKSQPLIVVSSPAPEAFASAPLQKPFTPPFTAPSPPINTPKPTTTLTTNPFLTTKKPFTPPRSTTLELTTRTSTSTTPKTTRPFVPLFNEPATTTPKDDSSYKVDPLSLYQCPEPGFYPFERNCNEFYVCQEILPGILISEQLYSCPKRYLFDPKTSRCQKASKVSCPASSNSPEEDKLSAKTNILVVHEQFLDLFFSTPLNYYTSKYFDK